MHNIVALLELDVASLWLAVQFFDAKTSAQQGISPSSVYTLNNSSHRVSDRNSVYLLMFATLFG